MKSTVVPAQVTTVEDKISGNISFTQLLLLVTPVFISGALFVFLPPFLHLRGYKLGLSALIAFVCLTLAVRIKGKIVLNWVSVIARYNIRPRYFIYNKNDSHLRQTAAHIHEAAPKQKAAKPLTAKANNNLLTPVAELVRIEGAVSDPRAKFHFKATKKGGLRVYIQEVR